MVTERFRFPQSLPCIINECIYLFNLKGAERVWTNLRSSSVCLVINVVNNKTLLLTTYS